MTHRPRLPFFSVVCSALLCSLSGACSPPAPTGAPGVPSTTSEVSATNKAVGPSESWAPEPGFARLTLSDLTPFPPAANGWTMLGDTLSATGLPRSYLFTQQDYTDFTLRLDVRFPEVVPVAGAKPVVPNTGVLVYLTEPHRVWPISLEVQGKYPELGSLRPNGGLPAPVIHDDEAFRLSQRKPPGEWNSLEIVSQAGALRVLLNGVEVSRSEPIILTGGNTLSTGKLGLQAEGAPYEMRRLRIRTSPAGE